jgi:hypothetical protein
MTVLDEQAPGSEVVVRTRPGRRGAPTATGPAFLPVLAERGPVGTPVQVSSAADYADVFGARVPFGVGFDAVELFTGEGGATLYLSRVVGPNPVVGSLLLSDRAGAPLPTLRVEALSAGEYSSRLAVQVLDGALPDTFTLLVFEDDVQREQYTDLTSPASAVTATAFSRLVRLVDLASGTAAPGSNPAVLAKTALSAGTDDRANLTDVQWERALDVFDSGLGPGQVLMPGRSSATAHAALVRHAAAHNRTAYLDTADKPTREQALLVAGLARALPTARVAGLFGPWVTIPALLPGGPLRAVPGSVFSAALTARSDADPARGPHTAPAGDAGVARYAVGLSGPGFAEADRGELNAAGVNVIRLDRVRGLQLYGFRSVSGDPNWRWLANVRAAMSLVARFDEVGEQFVLSRQVDDESIADFNAALRAVLQPDVDAGAVFDPFVDTGDTVNTRGPQGTREAGQFRARVEVAFSPTGERSVIELVKTSANG